MRKTLFILSAWVLCSCDGKGPDVVQSEPEVATEEIQGGQYEEVWMMQGWQGYMCVVIGLKESEFDYWMISDVSPGPDYNEPTSGTYYKGTWQLVLHPYSEDEELYDHDWRFVEHDGARYLVSRDDMRNERDSGRWLISVDPTLFSERLDVLGPFHLHMNQETPEMPNKSE